MPFQPDSAVDTALWRWQFTDSQGRVTSEVYINLGMIKFIKTTRVTASSPASQSDTVAIWYYGNLSTNPDVTLDDGAATAFLADLDAIWAG